MIRISFEKGILNFVDVIKSDLIVLFHFSPSSCAGDINFARDLSDLRHRNGLKVVLVHGQAASEALKTCANKAVRYDELLADLPFRSPMKVL